MAIANATKVQRAAARDAIAKLLPELQMYVQGLQPKAPDSGYNTTVNAMVDTAITALTAVKNA